MIRDMLTGPVRVTLARTIDVPVARRPLPALPFIVSGAAEVAALVVLFAHPGSPVAVLLAAVFHVSAAAPLALSRELAPSERMLAAALALTLPLFGTPLAALALGTVGRSEITQAPPDGVSTFPPLDPEEVRRMAEALPCCEALLAGGIEERRAIIATLTRRADADALALLRWALGAPDAELAVEAALALEDVGATFEARLDAVRRDVRGRPSFATALEAAETLTQAIDAGIADPSLVASLAHEARGFFEQAARLEPARSDVVALGRAGLELAVLRPDTALACIDAALAAGPALASREELMALRQEAVLASHALPWEGPSALATYRAPMPPPLTARRRLVPGSRGASTRRTLIERAQTPASSTRHLTLVPVKEVRRDRG